MALNQGAEPQKYGAAPINKVAPLCAGRPRDVGPVRVRLAIASFQASTAKKEG